MKKFFITLMCIIMVVCFMPTVAFASEGKATTVTPDYSWYSTNKTEFELADFGDLLGFANIVNGTAGEGNPSQDNFSKKTVKLTGDIDLNGSADNQWTPINGFVGTLDGGYQDGEEKKTYTISNLYVHSTNPEGRGFGFFGNSNGTVKNVTFNNVHVMGNSAIAAVAGSSNGKFTNIKVTGQIEIGTTTNQGSQPNFNSSYIGGIVGYGYCTVKSCQVIGNGAEISIIGGGRQVGGIIGFCGEGKSVRAENCVVKDITLKGGKSIGGILGWAHYGNGITSCSVNNIIVELNGTGDLDSAGLLVGTSYCNVEKYGINGINKYTEGSATDSELYINGDKQDANLVKTLYAGYGANYYIANGDNNEVAFYDGTLSQAVNNATNGQVIGLFESNSDKITIPEEKSIIIDLNGFSLSGDITNNGDLTIKNGTVFGSISGKEPVLVEASEETPVARNRNNIYYSTVQEGIQNGALWLLTDVNENVSKTTGSIDLYCDLNTFTGSLSCPGEYLYINNGTAILDNIECNTFCGGFSDYSASITVKNGTATKITAAKNANVTIEGGTYTGTITVASDGNGSLTIKGGTFSTNVSAYIPEGYVEYAMRDGTYIVKAATDPKPEFTTGNYWSDLVGKVYTEMYSAPYVPSTPSTPTDNVNNSGTAGTDNATTSADLSGSTTTSNDTTATAVDKTTADKIVDKAVANKSQEVVIDATANTAAAAASTTIAQVTIPTETLGAIADKTEADVTIKTDVAEVKLDNAAAGAVAAQATSDTVQIIAEKVAEEADKVEFELKVVCSEGKVISDFNGGNIAVTVALPKAMAEKKVVCVYIDDNGNMSKVEGQKNADGTYTFVTGHFSTYAILSEEEADAAIAAQNEAIKNIKIKLTSKQVKTKSGKKGIKITWTAAAGDKVLDGVEVFRSKEKNKGYGTKAFFTSTKGWNKGSYINTKSLKKGTRYYYKVRGYVLVNGEKVYTDYSTKAWRTVK